MRTRTERKLDKMMAQKRKNWEIESRLKLPVGQPMEWTLETQTEPLITVKSEDGGKSKTKITIKPKAEPKPKRKPKVKMSRKRETQTLLRRNFEFHVIGSGRKSQRADSAGHKFDRRYQIRTAQRIRLVNALIGGGVPVGAVNAMSLATRIESAIYRVLSQDSTEYEKYCQHCAKFIEDNYQFRYELVLGRLDADEFVLIPSESCQMKDLIEMRIKFKEEEEKEKIKQLKELKELKKAIH